ncbi:7-cyano-7-deazaguanine synthase QueC [Bartonella sp. DGB1]|uniref:7-cyano-7-deazaguanine synthase QueC n=1 Tax=Bartonella sp. DGB1 TaxID=3239807 RepID=UPI003525492E
MKTFVICSGGLDSVSLAYKIAHEQNLVGLISFDYGQKHSKELHYAKICADNLKVPHILLDISHAGKQLSGSALTDNIAVPDGYYTQENMKVTVVPNRNAIMLAFAFGIASANKADAVALAVHGGDHFIYPDCRPEFIESFAKMQQLALAGYSDIKLLAPYVHLTKYDIVADGNKYNTPFINTWSCYKGGDNHCGRCGTCVERQEAFYLANVIDPTFYEDKNYWRENYKNFINNKLLNEDINV